MVSENQSESHDKYSQSSYLTMDEAECRCEFCNLTGKVANCNCAWFKCAKHLRGRNTRADKHAQSNFGQDLVLFFQPLFQIVVYPTLIEFLLHFSLRQTTETQSLLPLLSSPSPFLSRSAQLSCISNYEIVLIILVPFIFSFHFMVSCLSESDALSDIDTYNQSHSQYTLLLKDLMESPWLKGNNFHPTSHVSTGNQIKKWVGDKLQLIALCESTKDDVHGYHSFYILQGANCFYETFRMHSSKFDKSGSCDLLICDEAHRLKNDQTLTNRIQLSYIFPCIILELDGLSCNRRILLSGTPMQNDLEEFFAMVNFTNSGILGDAAYFRRYYESPIISEREPTTTEEERNLSVERPAELSTKVNQFILRRTNALLSNHLPPKIVEVVCCKLSHLQSELYNHFIHSKNVKRAISEEAKQSKILAYITALKKLCNHPKVGYQWRVLSLLTVENTPFVYFYLLIYVTIKSGSGTSGFEDCIQFFPHAMFSGRSGAWTGGDGIWVELSGKMHVLARLLAQLRSKTDDRIVLFSNYTQTLNLFAQLCRERRYPHLRLDGTTSISKTQKLVNCFNDASKDEFVFLLSSKAGGCGLNLIGGNRLVLFDPDWNPANDKQAATRVWRDGQKKRVYIYRFLSTGTIEEKVYQRQMSKEGLQKVIQKEKGDSLNSQNFYCREMLFQSRPTDLFTFYEKSKVQFHLHDCYFWVEHTQWNDCYTCSFCSSALGSQKFCRSYSLHDRQNYAIYGWDSWEL
ncbi:hypothetical protein MKW92_040715, partial [Papaver armeniacum]